MRHCTKEWKCFVFKSSLELVCLHQLHKVSMSALNFNSPSLLRSYTLASNMYCWNIQVKDPCEQFCLWQRWLLRYTLFLVNNLPKSVWPLLFMKDCHTYSTFTLSQPPAVATLHFNYVLFSLTNFTCSLPISVIIWQRFWGNLLNPSSFRKLSPNDPPPPPFSSSLFLAFLAWLL